MELWIRSQDKERLMKTTDLRIYYASAESIWVIEDCDDLGYYKTKERALEVLDEIQCKLDYIYELSLRQRSLSTIEHKIVYEMPEE